MGSRFIGCLCNLLIKKLFGMFMLVSLQTRYDFLEGPCIEPLVDASEIHIMCF